MCRNKVPCAREQTALNRIPGYFLTSSINQETPMLTHFLFVWHGYGCRAARPEVFPTGGRGLAAPGHWWRWQRSALEVAAAHAGEATAGAATVMWRGMCHPLLPLLPPFSIAKRQPSLFLLLPVELILENSWFKILIIKENCSHNLCWLLGRPKKCLAPEVCRNISSLLTSLKINV